jgi:hypothetical protein
MNNWIGKLLEVGGRGRSWDSILAWVTSRIQAEALPWEPTFCFPWTYSLSLCLCQWKVLGGWKGRELSWVSRAQAGSEKERGTCIALSTFAWRNRILRLIRIPANSAAGHMRQCSTFCLSFNARDRVSRAVRNMTSCSFVLDKDERLEKIKVSELKITINLYLIPT